MKKSGIVRRLDELGRIVVPKEIRKTLHIKEGTPLEINIEEQQIVLKKYSPIKELGENAKICAECLFESISSPIFVVDLEKFVCGVGSKIQPQQLSEDCKSLLNNRKSKIHENFDKKIFNDENNVHNNIYIAPIVVEGDVLGAIIVDFKAFDDKAISNIELTAKLIGKLAF